MLHLLDATLESFLRSEAALRAGDVEVSFDAPDREWAAALTGPTVNLFLWDVRQHLGQASSGTEVVERNGALFRRSALPRIRLGYVATAWATDPRTEHQLLGAVLRALLAGNEIPEQFVDGALVGLGSLPSLEVGKPRDEGRADVWSALGGSFRPGIDIGLTVTVDPLALRPAASPPVSVEVGVTDTTRPERTSRRRRVVGPPASAGGG
ncbi:MAG: DUF4255 domain-containing protein [Acidimicrobiales bacterium]